jgi:hypothetical protein
MDLCIVKGPYYVGLAAGLPPLHKIVNFSQGNVVAPFT